MGDKKKKDRISTDGTAKGGGIPGAASPFAGLAGLRDALPPGPAPPPAPPPEPPPELPPELQVQPSRAAKGPARAVVRLERKGRGGKETTRVDKLGLDAGELARWCGALKKALGCGGVVEDDAIVLQGDLRKRIEPVLVARGVRKVTIG